jgi:predicted amidohydrolase YtcJ
VLTVLTVTAYGQSPAKQLVIAHVTVIDVTKGKFVIPGLWDMHIHLSWTTESALPLLVATGITDVRDMGGRLTQIDDWRSRSQPAF